MTTAEARAVRTALRCPFLGCQGRGARPVREQTEDGPTYQVQCGDCGARGPLRTVSEAAVQAWNATTEPASRGR